MNQPRNRRPDEFDDRSRNQHNRHDERRPHDRFGDNYEPRRHDWREPDRDDRRRFDSPWDEPQRSPADERRRHEEDDDRRRGFRNYGDYAGSDRGRGYGPGRPEAGRADYARDRDDNRRDNEPGFRPNATSGYIRDEQRAGSYSPHDDDSPRRRGYDDARNLPARGDFDRGSSVGHPADRFYENYRDDFARRPERRNTEPSGRENRRDDNRSDQRYDGRDGARSDYGYGDDYSSSLYDPSSRNSAFRRSNDDDRPERRQPDANRRWTDSPDLDNQRRR